jgi:putative transposase
MKKSKYSEQQIITLLKEVELGAKVGETCRKYGISEATYYKWKSAYSGMDASQLRQLRELQANTECLYRALQPYLPNGSPGLLCVRLTRRGTPHDGRLDASLQPRTAS